MEKSVWIKYQMPRKTFTLARKSFKSFLPICSLFWGRQNNLNITKYNFFQVYLQSILLHSHYCNIDGNYDYELFLNFSNSYLLMKIKNIKKEYLENLFFH